MKTTDKGSEITMMQLESSLPKPPYNPYLYRHLRGLSLSRNYIFLAVVYGLSTLLIPFGVQMLVNNLALTGLWVSTLSFLLLIGAGLIISLAVKFAQVVLVEYLQRHLLNNELSNWYDDTPEESYQSPYYFEMFKMLKSFASVTSDGIDLLLTCFFGILALMFIHPAFLVISLLFVIFLFIIRLQGRGAIRSSIEESNQKYRIYHHLDKKDFNPFSQMSYDYFVARDNHFSYIRRQSMTVFLCYFLLQIILLAWGIHLIQIQQLSLGQLVSAEIILSGMLISFSKLPKLLESFYDFETSCYKIDYAKGKGH